MTGSGLIERLEAAESGSRELDHEIDDLFSEWVNLGGWRRRHKTTGVEEGYSYVSAAPVTTSIDAALALAERAGWTFWSGGQGTLNAWAHLYERHPDQDGPTLNAKAKTPALAICAAILRARSALQSNAGGV